MPNPSMLNAETRLYCASEPEGRLFQAGEQWPGDAWSARPGGEPSGANAAAGALRDLITANETNERLGMVIASKDHDLAQVSAQRDEVLATVADLEQRAIAAEGLRADAEAAAKSYMTERDQARAELQTANQALAKLQTESTARIEAITEELDGAMSTIADLNGKVASLTSDLDAATAPKLAKGSKGAGDAAPAADGASEPAKAA